MTGNYPETKYPKITLTVKFTRYIPSVQISKRFTVEYMEKGVKKTRYEDRKVWEILDDKEYDRYLEDRKTRQRLYYDILKAIVFIFIYIYIYIECPKGRDGEQRGVPITEHPFCTQPTH